MCPSYWLCVSLHSALLGFLLRLATVKLKSGLSFEHFGVWIFLSKVTSDMLNSCNTQFIAHTRVDRQSQTDAIYLLDYVLSGYCHAPVSIYFLCEL